VITISQSLTGALYFRQDERVVWISRREYKDAIASFNQRFNTDYNPNQPRDARGRWTSGGGGSRGGGRGGGGGSRGSSRGGGGGLANKRVSELQEIAKKEGIDVESLSYKNRKSVLTKAIKVNRKGQNLREQGLLKAIKPKSSLAKKRAERKQQNNKKTESISDRVKATKEANKKATQEKANRIKPWEDSEYDSLDETSRKKRAERQQAIINAPLPPPKLKKLSQAENEELDSYNNILMENTSSERISSPKMRNFMDAIGMKNHNQASVASRSLGLNALNQERKKGISSSVDKLDQELRVGGGYALSYAGQIGGRYGELYNRRVAESLESLPTNNIVHIASKSYYTQLPRIGEPLQVKYLADRTPTVFVAELKRRKLLDVDNPGIPVNASRQRLRTLKDLKGLPDNAFTGYR